jgi:hypothetical protein
LESQSPEVAPPTAKPRRWRHHWPVLIPLVLIGGLLWIGLWYSRRGQLLEDASHVNFGAPTWAWLESFAGPEVRFLITSPTALNLSDGQTTPANLRIVAGFDELTHFAARDMTDADLEYLAGCTKLESLHLHRSSITDVGVTSLARFRRLEHLNINTDQPLTGDALSSMEHFKQLKSVWIETPRISDLSLVPFGSLRKLEYLTLSGAQIRGDRLAPLTKLPGLRRLGLRNCQIGVEALAALQPSLSGPHLFLDGSDVTDEHILAVEQLTWLLFVSFGNTQVSDEACLRLKQARPGIHIRNARGERVQLPDGSR